ncbi:hypothetical protein JB92DRAFT_2983303 [Gautieria morchelliformis]|nr:hypothetical protein JB92DRAFT_2983303 [Gautieria morchelliformis]
MQPPHLNNQYKREAPGGSASSCPWSTHWRESRAHSQFSDVEPPEPNRDPLLRRLGGWRMRARNGSESFGGARGLSAVGRRRHRG